MMVKGAPLLAGQGIPGASRAVDLGDDDAPGPGPGWAAV